MSEYQLHDFRAVDDELSAADQTALRRYSSRADITSTGLSVVHHYGNFRGNPEELVQRYFDAFLHETNFGFRELMFRFPKGMLDARAVKPYLVEDRVQFSAHGKHVILNFRREDQDGGWVDDEEAHGWLDQLLPIRDEIMAGDLRALFLGWLSSVNPWRDDDEPPDTPTPPFPAGLQDPTKPQKVLASFLGVDLAALKRLAKGSPTPSQQDIWKSLPAWVKKIPAPRKDKLLVTLMRDGNLQPLRALTRTYRQQQFKATSKKTPETDLQMSLHELRLKYFGRDTVEEHQED